MKFDKAKWFEAAGKKGNELHKFYPESSISKLFDEIERLEKEVDTLKKRASVDPANPKFIAVKDGNSWYFSLPDFINLQESNLIFCSQYDVDMDYIYMLLLQNNATNRLYGAKEKNE